MQKTNINNFIIPGCITFSVIVHTLLFNHYFYSTGHGQVAENSLPSRLLVKFSTSSHSPQNQEVVEQALQNKKPDVIKNAVNKIAENKANAEVQSPFQSIPSYKKKVTPKYPQRARQLGQEGRVEIMIELNKNGEVIKAYVHKSSGYALLDAAALSAIKQYLFNTGADEPFVIPYYFKLD